MRNYNNNNGIGNCTEPYSTRASNNKTLEKSQQAGLSVFIPFRACRRTTLTCTSMIWSYTGVSFGRPPYLHSHHVPQKPFNYTHQTIIATCRIYSKMTKETELHPPSKEPYLRSSLCQWPSGGAENHINRRWFVGS